MKNRMTSAGANADSSTNADVTTSSQTIAKLIVSGSASSSFLLDAVNELFTYRTPQAIVDFVNKEKIKCIIANPPYKQIKKI
jgi:hypothetical protein